MKYVYLMRCGGDRYKVGITNNLLTRLSSLKSSNPDPIDLVCCRLCNNAELLERHLHTYLVEHKTNGGTEWFKLSPEQAIEVAILMHQEPEANDLWEALDSRKVLEANKLEYQAIMNKLRYIQDFIEKEVPIRIPMLPSISESLEPTIRTKKIMPKNDEQYLPLALEIFKKEGRASASLLQRRLSIGYAKAARILDTLEAQGSIGSFKGYIPHSAVCICNFRNISCREDQ